MSRWTKWTTAALVAAAMTTMASPGRAHVDPELRGGYYTDAEQAFVGGGILTSVAEKWDFNPNLEWVFVDGGNLFTLNADFHRDLNSGSGPAVWLGAGPALIVSNPDAPDVDTDTNIGLNLIGGVGAKSGSVRPFGQAKYTISDDNEASVAFGLRF